MTSFPAILAQDTAAETTRQAWLDTVQALLLHYLPPIPPTAPVYVGSLLVFGAGLFLVFRTKKFARAIVSIFGCLLGAWLGARVAAFVGAPGPILAAIGAVGLTLIAHRTYRVWLAIGSTVVLFAAAMVIQLGRPEVLQRFVEDPQGTTRAVQSGEIHLPSAEEQARNLHPTAADELNKLKDRIWAELENMGPIGWLIPLAAAIVGVMLAIWALSLFAVIWIGFVGAVLSVMGACTFLSAQWPDMRTAIINAPQYPAGAIIVLWLGGLLLQAKEARLPKKQPAKKGGD